MPPLPEGVGRGVLPIPLGLHPERAVPGVALHDPGDRAGDAADGLLLRAGLDVDVLALEDAAVTVDPPSARPGPHSGGG